MFLFMLDKSLVYKDIVMCLPFEDLDDLKVPVFLYDGYSYKMFESKMRLLHIDLIVLVGEFDCFNALNFDIKLFKCYEEF